MDSEIAGCSVQNREIEKFIFGTGDDVVLVIGAIHGDEPASAVLAHQLVRYLRENTSSIHSKKVIIVPVVNPDGLAAGTRTNANGVDLNRNFPANNRVDADWAGYSPLSEPESRLLFHIISEHGVGRIITIHQPYGCIDYDGPAKHIAEKMGEHCDLPVTKLGGRPGSLGSWAGLTMGIPIITVELFGEDINCTPDEIWQLYGRAILAGIYN